MLLRRAGLTASAGLACIILFSLQCTDRHRLYSNIRLHRLHTITYVN